MKLFVSFATHWGSQFGGINSFNHDLLKALAAAFSPAIKVVCVVPSAKLEEINSASKDQVALLPLDIGGKEDFSTGLCEEAFTLLRRQDFLNDCDQVVWLGHDRITGLAALDAAEELGGRSALIHHMSYSHYESFSENSIIAENKKREQRSLFERAAVVMAVGPLLRDALGDLLDQADVPMLVPGLPDIKVKTVFTTFRGFISGRLNNDAKKNKQGHLGVAAFALAIKRADSLKGLPEVLRGVKEPELTLRGVDFEEIKTPNTVSAEEELKSLAQQYAGRAIRMHVLPFTTDRADLFTDLRSASVVMMPSWHEGFGLVGWEAVAAGVPLIVSQKSGLYRLLCEIDDGLYSNLAYPIDVAGCVDEPYFQESDLESLTSCIIEIARDSKRARSNAMRLREELLKRYRWPECAHSLVEILGWASESKSIVPSAVSSPIKETANSLNSDSALLSVPSPIWRANAGYSNSWLLRAEESIIPFDSDREPFLDEQLQWVNSSDYNITVRLLTGVGGTGKTRLALELCCRLKADGWNTGFLSTDNISDVAIQHLVGAKVPVFLVIDYAETRQNQLLILIKKLLVLKGVERFRIMLLARDGGEWWSLLPAKDTACEALLGGMATTGPFLLPQLHDSLSSRQVAYKRAMAAFSEKLGVLPKLGTPDLEDMQFSHPLYVQMAALLALYGEQPGSGEAVARSLVNHERRYWAKALATGDDAGAPHEENAALFMALATLVNGLHTARDAELLWVKAGRERHSLKHIFSTMVRLYPDRQGAQGLRPDLLGEALIAQCLLSQDGKMLLSSVLGSNKAGVRRASLTVLARLLRSREELAPLIEAALTESFLVCVDDLTSVIVANPGPFAHVVERAFSALPDARKYQACGVLYKYIQDDIVPLADLAVLVERANLKRLDEKNGTLKRSGVDELARRADTLNNLAVSLVWQGNFEEAASYSCEALAIYDRLELKKPGRFSAECGRLLSNYGNQLDSLGKCEDAETIAKRSLEIREKLAADNPQRWEPDLAASLSNYAGILSNLGRDVEAESKGRQAMELYEKLAKEKPEQFLPDLAMALNNYANHLLALMRGDEAEVKARQALDIYENLARAKPERFEPDWANCLGNYGNHLRDLGRSTEAETNAKQAVQIHERLALSRPDRFQSDWADSLLNYANHLSDLGRNDEAVAAARRVLNIYQELVQVQPERFMSDWATSLSNYSAHLCDLGVMEEAETKGKESVRIREELALENPDRFERKLADSLSNYAHILMVMRNGQMAEVMARRSLEIREKQAAQGSERYAADLGISLDNYSVQLACSGRIDEALIYSVRAVEIFDALKQKRPERFEPNWAHALVNCAYRLCEQGNIPNAIVKAEQALGVYKRFYVDQPARFEFGLITCEMLIALCKWLGGYGGLLSGFRASHFSTAQDRRVIEYLRCFLRIFSSNNFEVLEREFTSVSDLWGKMHASQRFSVEPYRYVLCAFAEFKSILLEADIAWREDLRAYRAQRQGGNPWWMLEVASRVGFSANLAL